MKKVLICGLVAASFGMTSAFADGTADFKVTASVNSKCVSDNGTTTPTADFGPVDAFATSVPDATADVKFKCTRGVKITGAHVSKPSSVVAGFGYTASAGTPSQTTNGAAADAAAGTGAGADGYTVTVTAKMTGGQAGDITTGVSTSDDQVLTIEF